MMKTTRLIQTVGFALLSVQLSTGLAQYGQQALRLQGTCTETDGSECNQKPEWRNGGQANGAQQNSQQLCVDGENCINAETIANTTLTAEEQQSLLFMREEEKLARDVYTVLYEKWKTPVFANISMSEQRHMDSVLWLMQQYDVADIASEEVGVFNNAELQDLYNSLIARGETSQIEALQVGALIEEVDIADLQKGLANTANQAIQTLYNSLIAGSENHLRSFVRNIENLGYRYTAQVLDATQISDILSGDASVVGFAINPDSAQLQFTQAQFRPSISTDKGQYGSQLQVSTQEKLNVNMTIMPDTQHRNEIADIVNVVSYRQQNNEQIQMVMQSANGWQSWDGSLDTLEAQSQQQLNQQQRVNVFEGQISAKGHYQINVGYRLNNGTLVFNSTPIEFTVSD